MAWNFEDAVCEFLVREAQHAGDVAIPTGNTTGLIKNCKVGDCVVELGPDSAAPGAKIVIEAKEEAGYTLAAAREEIETARKNRGADWGLFVFSQEDGPCRPRAVPTLRQRFRRHLGRRRYDRAMCFSRPASSPPARCASAAERQSAAQQVDFEAIEKAILEIEKRAGNLDEVRKSAETIQSSSTKILDRVRIDREALEKQVEVLREKVGDLREFAAMPQ